MDIPSVHSLWKHTCNVCEITTGFWGMLSSLQFVPTHCHLCLSLEIENIHLGCFRTYSLIHLDQLLFICILPLFLFGFHKGKISSKLKCINKSHVGVVILFTGQKLRWLNPLSFSHLLKFVALLNTWFFWMCVCVCVFSRCWAIRSSAHISKK